jgi:hypothetical protein
MHKTTKFQTNGGFTTDSPQDGSATVFKAEAAEGAERKENR